LQAYLIFPEPLVGKLTNSVEKERLSAGYHNLAKDDVEELA
jgi:hypothetical protein